MIAHISNISAQESPPLVTELDGRTVVVWSLAQDKENSRQLERGFMYFRRATLLQADTADYLAAILIANKRIENDGAQLSECQYQNTNHQTATATALKKAEFFESKAKKQKRLKVLTIIVSGVVLVLVAL